jgi:hypothetical protein
MQNKETNLDRIYTKINGVNKFGRKTQIRSIGIDYKRINGNLTDIRSAVFYVNEKKPISQLNADKIIPSTVIVNGIEYPTDVVEQKIRYTVLTDGCWGTNIASWSSEHKKRLRQYTAYDPQGNSQNTTPPSGTVNKPVQGGVSAGQQYGGTGTLGCIVQDDTNSTICGLSNLHVFVGDGFLASEKKILKDLGYPNKIFNLFKKGTVQSGEPKGGTRPSPYNKEQGIGFVKRYTPLYFWNWDESNNLVYHNYVDCAITSLQLLSEDSNKIPGSQLTQNAVIWSDSTKQLNMFFTDGSNPSNYPFATTEEIDSLQPGARVWKSGRTTGFVGKDECILEFKGEVPFINVYGYNFSIFSVEVLFEDVLKFGYRLVGSETIPRPAAILGGDSGSVLISDFNGTKKIIGLNFAGGPDSSRAGPGSAGFACRIDRVAQSLEISSFSTENMFWDANAFASPGQWEYANAYFDNPQQWDYLIESGYSDQRKIEKSINGGPIKTYYQFGLYK